MKMSVQAVGRCYSTRGVSMKDIISKLAKQVSEELTEKKEEFIRSHIERLGISLEAEIQARKGAPAQVLEEVLMEHGYKIEILYDPSSRTEHVQVWRLEEQLKLDYTINVNTTFEGGIL